MHAYMMHHAFYTADLVGAKRTILGLWRLSSTCFLLLNSLLFCSCSLGFYGGLSSFLFSLSESLAVGSTCFYTWPCQIRMLQRASHAVLPILHRQKTLSPYLILHRCPRIMYVSVNLVPRRCPAFRRLQTTFQWHLASWEWAQIDIPSMTSNWHS